MKSVISTLLLSLALSVSAQSVPNLPVEGEVRTMCYNGVNFDAVMFHGNQENYDAAIDYALTGNIVRTELYGGRVYSYIELPNDVIAIWFLAQSDPEKTDLFFYNEEQLEGVE